MQVSRTQLAINFVLVDQLADFLHGVEPELPEAFGGIHAHPFFNAGLVCPLACTNMPAVAARGAPANALGLQ